MGTGPSGLLWATEDTATHARGIFPWILWGLAEPSEHMYSHGVFFHGTRSDTVTLAQAYHWALQPGPRREQHGLNTQGRLYASSSTTLAAAYTLAPRGIDPQRPGAVASGPIVMFLCEALPVPAHERDNRPRVYRYSGQAHPHALIYARATHLAVRWDVNAQGPTSSRVRRTIDTFGVGDLVQVFHLAGVTDQATLIPKRK